MKMFMFEGTPQEVSEVMATLQTSVVALEAAAAVAPTVANDEDADERVFVTTEVARVVFSRRPMSHEQRTVLKVLAVKYPDWVAATELQAAVNYTPAQFAGLMGAFGRRLSHTDGYVKGSWLFDAEWDYERGCYLYRLPATVREALSLEGVA